MAGSIRTCPACKTLLLRDTVQCPECDHVFDEERHRKLTAAPADSLATQQEQDKCSSCGELVRQGMVRCWNCGSFMREDIGELYMKMQAKPAPVIYSDSHGGDEIYTVEEAGDAVLSDEASPRAEDDFELDADISRYASGDSTDTYSISGRNSEQAPSSGIPAESEAKADDPPAPDPPPTNGEASAAAEKQEPEVPAQPHSVATGGDALLQIALEEELEIGKRRRQPRKKGSKDRNITGFLVFCPNGHRIEVQDRHRGKAGRCPKCKSLFIVPEKPPEPQPAAETQAAEAGADQQAAEANFAGPYVLWMSDVHLHTVNPEKLRLKPGSLEKDFQKVELGFSPEHILIATLPAPKGFLGLAGGGKGDSAREALLASLREGTPLDDVPAASKRLVEAESLSQLAIDQPVVYEHESMFVGVPVFGAGRIAVRLPKSEAGSPPTFLSFDLSGFREFSAALDKLYGIEEFGALHEIPLTDEFTQVSCHYSEEKFRTLEHVEFYKTDSKSKLKLVGRKCQGCGLIVSEDARKKEKIGGAKGAGIAKALCPKCKAKFGDISLFDLEAPPEAEKKEESAEETSAATA
jgi:hypothetical protein